MKRGLMAIAILGAMGVGVANVQAQGFYRQSRAYAHGHPSYSCRVPTYHSPRRHYPTTVHRYSNRYPNYARPRTSYRPYGRAYAPYYPSSRAHFGVHGRNFSLHLGY